MKKYKIKIKKPNAKFPGSLIQQNYGEQVEKGYLIWDIEDKDNWDVEFKKLLNMCPFVTVPWQNSVVETINYIETSFKEYAFLPGTRYRISSTVNIPQTQSNLLIKELKEKYKASEVVFKTDVANKMDSIKTNGIKVSKKGLSNDPETILKLYKDYIEAHKDNFNFQEDYLEKVNDIIKTYLVKLHTRNSDFDQERNVIWSIKDFKFDNLFGYGENNTINFSNLENIVGILGNNATGKSSIIGAVMFTLFNTTDRGSLKNAHIINRNKNECYGMVRFSVNGEDYIVERNCSRKKNFDDAATTVKFWRIKIEDGKEIKISENGDSVPETDALIRKKIGTAEDFLLTTLASQGNINRFIENKATKRKEILNRFLELDIFDYLFEYAKNDYSNLENQNQKNSFKDLSKTIEKTEKEIEKYELEIQQLESKNKLLNEKRDELNVWVKSHENDAANIENSTFVNLNNYLASIEKESERLQTNLKNSKDKLKSNETNYKLLLKKIEKINIENLKEEQKLLNSIEKNIAEIKNNFNVENEKLKTNEKAIFKLSVVPCGDQFPTCHFIKDGHEAKTLINEQKKLVEKLTEDLLNTKKLFEKYSSLNLNDQIKQYDSMLYEKITLSSNIERIKDKISHDEEKFELLNNDLKNTKSKINLSKKTLEKLDSEEFKKKKNILQKIQEELNTIQYNKNDLLLKLGGKKQSLEKAQKEKEESRDVFFKLKLYESIQAAFSKNGIPAMILKTQLPAINRELAKILDNLMNFNVTLETDVTINIMDIYISDAKSKRLIEMCSGMEKTICSLALRVALTNLSSLPRTDMLVLDEAFGALDEENLQKSIELLALLRSYFKCIMVVTHETPIKEIADKILEIKFDGVESRIEA